MPSEGACRKGRSVLGLDTGTMNLLLLRPEECRDGQAELFDRRANHLTQVLRVLPGSIVRVGIIGRGITTGTVLDVRLGSVLLRLGLVEDCVRPAIQIVLALPRPKALSRTIQAVASFGVGQLTLINAWRVERSYFSSPRLIPARLEQDVWLGCEQGAQVHLPKVELLQRFTDFIERLQCRDQGRELRVCLHPRSEAIYSHLLATAPACLCLAIGPEGGFIERELESLRGVGFQIARMETGPLRTEVALAAALGQASVHFPNSGRRSIP